MNPLTQSKNTTILPVLIALTLGCFGLSPTVWAVDPPWDGFPNGNTAESKDALSNRATGADNTAPGFDALDRDTTGFYSALTSWTWTATGSLAKGRYDHTATLLPSGKVLVAGGYARPRPYELASAELYDPASGTWTATGSLAHARTLHTATLLQNGMVLVAGGYGKQKNFRSAELYDPTSGSWFATGRLGTSRARHTATLLPDGKVLVVGGNLSIRPFSYLASAELYDPASGTWTATGSLATGREYHTATLLPNGMVLVAGGFNGSELASAELYDPASGTWTATESLPTVRRIHTAALLPNGKVLVAGGYALGGALASAELYDPASGTWTATGSLDTARY